MDDILDNWVIQVRKGVVEFCILAALEPRERYGYELTRLLAETGGLNVPEGTVYPLLSRLKTHGLVESRLEESPDGPARKYYALTGEGRNTLRKMTSYMEELQQALKLLRRKGGLK